MLIFAVWIAGDRDDGRYERVSCQQKKKKQQSRSATRTFVRFCVWASKKQNSLFLFFSPVRATQQLPS
jgi:hypothetical protein